MGNTIAQPILRVVPPLTNQGESPPPPVPVVPPLSGAALLLPLPPPPPADLAAPAPEAPCEYPPEPDVVAIVREFAGPSGDNMTRIGRTWR